MNHSFSLIRFDGRFPTVARGATFAIAITTSVLLACSGSVRGDACGAGTHDVDGTCVADSIQPGVDGGGGVSDGGGPTSDGGVMPSHDGATTKDSGGTTTADASDAATDPLDMRTACLVNDNIIVVNGDPADTVHPGYLKIEGGVGWVAGITSDQTQIDITIGTSWIAAFSTRALGHPLIVGVYEDAQRFGFEDPNHPGLGVSGNGSGCSALEGRFEIFDVDIVTNGNGQSTVKGFTAMFEQHCQHAVAALYGCVRLRL